MPVDVHGRVIGCSWYCSDVPITVTASDTLRDGLYSYDPANIHDGNKSTIWAVAGQGIGTKVTFTFDMTGERHRKPRGRPFGINGFSFINGFARSPALWAANGRVKTFKVTFNGVPKGTLAVADTDFPQFLKLPNLELLPGKKSRLVLEIADTYVGGKYWDTCIADLQFDGYGDH